MRSRHLWACALMCAAMAGCSLFDGKKITPELTCDPTDPDCLKCDPAKDARCANLPEGGLPEVGAIGKACESDEQCLGTLRLSCTEGKCALTGDLEEGSTCNVTGECKGGLYCAVEGDHTCKPAGDGKAGDRCTSTGDCARDLVCALTGLTQSCLATGSGDIGTACGTTSDCLAGLFCPPPSSALPEPVCLTTPDPSKLRPPTWSGAECEKDDGPATAYFHVPRGDSSDKDFFRLPFPNDVRRGAEGLDLSGFPSPGNLLGIGDLVGNYVKASERDLDGFATNPVVYFRFSKPYAGNTITQDSVLLFNIDQDSPGYGRQISRAWGTSSGDITPYVCQDWLNVHTAGGEPLAANTTYAVVLTSAIKPSGGGSFARAEDLDALLADPSPSAALKAAHSAYAPLRAFIADGKLSEADVLNAAVFTTQSPEDLIAKLQNVIAAGSAPTVKDVTVCDTGVTSPCDDGAERVCGAANADFVEIHGRISLPIFQDGDAPYLLEGGGIKLNGSGTPQVVRNEDVCFGLALPKAAAPEAGYPVVIYGHGTGGSFKSGLSDLGKTAAGVGGAVLTIDLPQHGSRKNGSTRGSDELFYNFLNPDAALGNVAQGSADLMSIVAWVKSANETDASDFGQALRFDTTRIALFGHSQGATHASLTIPHEPGFVGVVLSGVGGDLSEGLTTKKSPIDIARAMPFLLADPAAQPYDKDTCNKCVGSNHPVYALLQGFFERVDPVNFGASLTTLREGATAKHIFMTYGENDTYAPEGTQKAYAVSAKLPHVGEELTKLYKAGPVPAPVSENVTIGEINVTRGVRQYNPKSGEDGHFVYLGDGKADWQRFLEALLEGTTPQIGE